MNSEELISKARQVVLDNLLNQQFGVSMLAKELGTSRSELYRRIKAAKSNSVSQFIREIRLEKAAELLHSNEHSISEVADMVGFNSPTYFSTCYKEYYGYSPSEPKAHRVETGRKVNRKFRKWAIPISIIALISVVSLSMFSLGKDQNTEGQKSLAVLKFDYFGADSTDSFLANTVADEIINNLSNLGSLKVVSASSSFQVDKDDEVGKIGNKLGVGYLIDGSLMKHEDRLKISVKLIDVNTGYQLWSETFEEQFEDFFELQELIAQKVADELKISLASDLTSTDNPNRTTSFKAFELYVKALELGEFRQGELIDEAIELLETAVDLDPNFAEAYAEMSFLYGQKHDYGNSNREERDKMMRLNIKKAFELDAESPEVLFAKADFDFKTRDMQKDSSMVIAALRKVLKIKPNDARSAYRLYQLFRGIGQNDVAHGYLEKAVSLDPLSSFYKTILARDYFWKKGEKDKGLGLIEEVLNDDPKRPAANYFKALMLADEPLGDLVGAFKFLHQALQENPYAYGYLYWGSILALDLELIPIAKRNMQMIEIRFPNNARYTFEAALNILLVQKRYDDALHMTKVWGKSKNLDEEIVAARMARIYFLKGQHNKSKEILLQRFSELFTEIANGGLSIKDLKPSLVSPIRTYIEILREEGKEKQALEYADFLCSHFQELGHGQWPLRFVKDSKSGSIDCYYLQNDLDGFLVEIEKSFFETKSRLALFGSLKNSRYKAFESRPAFKELYNRIQKETLQLRSEIIDYLDEQGDWNTSWNEEQQMNVQ